MSEIAKEFRGRTLILTQASIFTWSIENFSFCSLEGDDFLKSSVFTTGESLPATWCLHLYPNKNEYIGIFLKRTSSDSSAHYVTAEFSLIDASQKKCHSNRFRHSLYENFMTANWGFGDVISRKQLLEDRLSLLPEDTLTVMCELKVTRVDDAIISNRTEESKSNDSPDCKVFEKPKSLMGDLQQLLENQTYSDFTLKIGDEELNLHKNIPCARSSVFNTMLNCDMKENLTNSLEVTDFDPPVVKSMVRYIYCGRVEDLTPEISIQLYSIADKYNLQDLKDICIKYISGNLNIDNICDVLTLGELHDQQPLKIAARNFICMNAADIQETEKWLSLSKTMPDLILDMYRLVVSQTRNVTLNGKKCWQCKRDT